MSGWKKLAAGGGTAPAPLNVEDVFGCDPHDTTGSAFTITNNIDLAGSGGLIWSKARQSNNRHILVDTVNGLNKNMSSNLINGQFTATNTVTSVSSTGFTYGTDSNVNVSNERSIHYTFRQAENFFDIQTYTGNGVAGRTISHNLGSTPGFIIIKRTDGTGDWAVYHRELGEGTFTTPEDYYMILNSVDGVRNSNLYWNDTAPTSTTITLGTDADVNANGSSYVAYIWAHHDGTGTFGENGDQDIIYCGRMTGNNTMQLNDIGFEAQWFFTKRMNGTDEDWKVVDNLRGLSLDTDPFLSFNVADSEGQTGRYYPDADGFRMDESSNIQIIYVAIRIPMSNVIDSGTDVFAVDTWGGTSPTPPSWTSNFKVGGAIVRSVGTTANNSFVSRKSNNKAKFTALSSPGTFGTSQALWQYQNGWYNNTSTISTYYSWMFKRTPGFFDVQSYTGTGNSQQINHNLGVAPEFMWVADMFSTNDLVAYHKDASLSGSYTAASYFIYASEFDKPTLSSQHWNSTQPTATNFTVGTDLDTGWSGRRYIAWLWASVDGICKVGSYTGNGGSLDVDCGFSSSARFVLIKPKTQTGYWFLFDSLRGITTSSSPFVVFQSTQAQVTSFNILQPYSSGFKAVQDTSLNYVLNTNGQEYLFLAIA